MSTSVQQLGEVGNIELILKISSPVPGQNFSQVKDYESENECSCSQEYKLERTTLIKMYEQLEMLTEEYFAIVIKNRYAPGLEERRVELINLYKTYKTFLRKVKPPTCPCWANTVYEFRYREYFGPVETPEKGVSRYAFIENGITYYALSRHTNYFYDKKGIVVADKNTSFYYLSPKMQRLRPCHWHGYLPQTEKERLNQEYNKYKQHRIDVAYEYAYNQHADGNPPEYGVYVFFSDDIDIDVVCYDTCYERDSEMRKEELLIKDDESTKIRRFVKTLQNKFDQITNKMNSYDDLIRVRSENVKELSGLKLKLNELSKITTTTKDIEEVKLLIDEATRKYNKKLIEVEALWKKGTLSMQSGNITEKESVVPSLEDILRMPEPSEDDTKLRVLWELVQRYNELLVSNEEGFNLTVLANKIIREYKVAHNLNLRKTEPIITDFSENSRQNFLEANTGAEYDALYSLQTRYKTLEKQKDAKERELNDTKERIKRLEISIAQMYDSIIRSSKLAYFESRRFMEQAMDCLVIGRKTSFIYQDPDIIISEATSAEQARDLLVETQTKFRNYMKFIEEKYNAIEKRYKKPLQILSEFNYKGNLETEYSSWLELQKQFSVSGSVRIAESVRYENIQASIVIEGDDDNMFKTGDTNVLDIKESVLAAEPIQPKVEKKFERKRTIKVSEISPPKIPTILPPQTKTLPPPTQIKAITPPVQTKTLPPVNEEVEEEAPKRMTSLRSFKKRI